MPKKKKLTELQRKIIWVIEVIGRDDFETFLRFPRMSLIKIEEVMEEENFRSYLDEMFPAKPIKNRPKKSHPDYTGRPITKAGK